MPTGAKAIQPLLKQAASLKATMILTASLMLLVPNAKCDFHINWVFDPTTTVVQQNLLKEASTFWESKISGYRNGTTLTGCTIYAQVLVQEEWMAASAGPSATTMENGTHYTTSANLTMNSIHVERGIREGWLLKTLEHEIGHALGIGTLWTENNFYINDTGKYTGNIATTAWRDEYGQKNATYVPVELFPRPGTMNAHWDESDTENTPTGYVSRYSKQDFSYELMTGVWNEGSSRAASTVTYGSLVDMGYEINSGAIPTDNQGNYKLTDGAIFTAMQGNASMEKTTGGAVVIYGDNSYTGGTKISEGKVTIARSSSLGAGSLYITGNSTLDVAETNLLNITTLTVEKGTIVGTTGSITANEFILKSGEIDATLRSGRLEKISDGSADGGIATLGAANAHTDGTFVTGGTLRLTNHAALGAGTTVVNGGTLDVNTTHVSSTAEIHLYNGTIAGTTGTLSAKSFDFQNGDVSANLTGAGLVLKSGQGVVTLSGQNTHTGGTVVQAGTLKIASERALASGPVTVNGGTMQMVEIAHEQISSVTLESGAITGTGTLSSITFGVKSGTISAGLTGDGSMSKTTAGTVELSGANTFTGGITVEAGTIVASGANALAAGRITTTGGNVLIRHADAAAQATVNLGVSAVAFDSNLNEGKIGTLEGTSRVTLANNAGGALALTLGTNNNSYTYSGGFTGAGSLIKGGTGTLVLSGAADHTGGTGVTGGTLQITRADALGTGRVFVNNGKLDLGSIAAGGITRFTLDGGSVVSDASGSLTAAEFELRAGSVLTTMKGAGTLLKTGTGTVTLTSANTYTGGTGVNQGTLLVKHAQALSSGAITVDGGTLQVDTSMYGITSVNLKSGALTGRLGNITAGDYTLESGLVALHLNGPATLVKNTDGEAMLTRDNSYTGGTTVNAGTLVITHQYALGKGITNVNAGGTLRVGDDSAFDAEWAGKEIRLTGGTLDVALASSTTVSRPIVGSGDIRLSGSGEITFTNATNTGNTTVDSGTLVLANGATMTGDVFVNPRGAVEIRSTGSLLEVNQSVYGTGTVRLSGTGEIRLTKTIGHTGEIIIAPGATARLGAPGAEPITLNNSLIYISQGARLSGSGDIAGSLVNDGTLSPGHSPGAIKLGFNFTNTGTLQMEIARTGAHDEIRYAGQAFLAGNLQIDYVGGAPAKGTIVPLLVDTVTTDAKPAIVGHFNSVTVNGGRGIAYATASGLNFVVGGTLFDIPGANIPQSDRLESFANTLAAAGQTNADILGVTSPFANGGATIAANTRNAAPLGFASATTLAIAQADDDTDRLYSHLTARRFERGGAWLMNYSPYVYVSGSSATADDGEDGRAFDHTSVGGSVGADYEPTVDTTLGAKIGYDAGKADFHHGAGDLSQDHLRLTVYASQLLESRYFVDAGVAAGYSLYDTKHNTALGRQTGDTTGWDLGAFVTTGMVAPITSTLSLTPHVGMAVTHAEVQGFDETGTPLALRVNGFSQNSMTTRAGAGLNQLTALGGTRVRVSLDATWIHEWLDTEIGIDGSLAGNRYGVDAVAGVKDRLQVGPEVNFELDGASAISVAYKFDYAFGDAIANRIDVGYRTRF